MFRHLAVGRWVKPALLLVALGFCGYGLYVERGSVAHALPQLSWWTVAGALAAVIAGLGCMMLSWRALLADLGSPLPARAAIRVLFIAQLGKYVPGAVWAAGAQVELGRAYQIPRTRSATAAVMNMLISLATGLLTAAVALPLSAGGAARHYWWALVLAVPALLALYPPLTSFLLDRALALARRPPLERRISMTGMARSVGWALLGWAFFSLHAWLLVTDLTGGGVRVLLPATGAYALAWSVGFIAIPFPGGVGPRELALAWTLSPFMAAGGPATVALVSRLVMTVADLAWAALGFWLGRGDRRRGVPAAALSEGGGGVAASPLANPLPANGDVAGHVVAADGALGEKRSFP